MTRLSPTATLSSCMPLFRSDRKSTRLNSSHDQFSYAVFCLDRKSTRLNSSHDQISYAVFCLKRKKKRLHAIDERITQAVWTLRTSLRLSSCCHSHQVCELQQ